MCGQFVKPDVEDKSKISRGDIIMCLPKPITTGGKRITSMLQFSVDLEDCIIYPCSCNTKEEVLDRFKLSSTERCRNHEKRCLKCGLPCPWSKVVCLESGCAGGKYEGLRVRSLKVEQQESERFIVIESVDSNHIVDVEWRLMVLSFKSDGRPSPRSSLILGKPKPWMKKQPPLFKLCLVVPLCLNIVSRELDAGSMRLMCPISTTNYLRQETDLKVTFYDPIIKHVNGTVIVLALILGLFTLTAIYIKTVNNQCKCPVETQGREGIDKRIVTSNKKTTAAKITSVIPKDSCDPDCLTPSVKYGVRDSVKVWAAISWFSAGPIIALKGKVTAHRYEEILPN
ncbi:hypothetical protein GQR58_022288 [Nymphon striatum]|nr:hypothetical protein GQR58_022288 [Nymphon striatum]